jgi:hypothetical protein
MQIVSDDQLKNIRIEVLDQLYDLFKFSLEHAFDKVREMHWTGPEFTKIGATDALGISNYEEAMRIEKYSFDRIKNGQFYIEDFHISKIDNVIITCFVLKVSGIYLPLNREMESKRRSTVVFVETPKGRKIIHKHFSAFPMTF